jgi:hypothetical protein
MTDRGTRVRWTTAALVAPAAAALFTGTTVWASAHQPATASTTTTAAPAPAKTVDPVVATLRTAIDSNSAQVLKLRASVAALQKQAAAIAKGANVPTAKSGSSSTWHATSSSSTRKSTTRSSSSKSSGSSSSGSSKPTVSKPAPAPAPKPPVASSGGS